jgi:hypothetical protein
MAVNLQKANRIIFQPTKDNEEKLKRLAKENGLTISGFLNQVISSLDDDASFGFKKPNVTSTADMIYNYDVIIRQFSSLEKLIGDHAYDDHFVCAVSKSVIPYPCNPWEFSDRGVMYDNRLCFEMNFGYAVVRVYPIINGDWYGDQKWEKQPIKFGILPYKRRIIRDEKEFVFQGYTIYAFFYNKTVRQTSIIWMNDVDNDIFSWHFDSMPMHEVEYDI